MNLFNIESKKQHTTKALKRYMILEPPKNLIINLKRFSQFGLAFSKNTKRVSFPMTLSLDDYMIHQVRNDDIAMMSKYVNAKDDDSWQSQYNYRLYGMNNIQLFHYLN